MNLRGWLSDDHVSKSEGSLSLKPGVLPEVLPVLTFTADGQSTQVISVPLAALLRPSGRLCIVQFDRPQALVPRALPDRIVFGAMVVSAMLVTLDYSSGIVGLAQRSVAAADGSSAACALARSCRDVETFILESNTCHHPCSNRWFFKYDSTTLQCAATSVIPSSIFAAVVVLVTIELALALLNSNAGGIL
jgi:hypothetical protein